LYCIVLYCIVSPLQVRLGRSSSSSRCSSVEVVFVEIETRAGCQQNQSVHIVELGPAYRLTENHVALYVPHQTAVKFRDMDN